MKVPTYHVNLSGGVPAGSVLKKRLDSKMTTIQRQGPSVSVIECLSGASGTCNYPFQEQPTLAESLSPIRSSERLTIEGAEEVYQVQTQACGWLPPCLPCYTPKFLIPCEMTLHDSPEGS